MISKTAHHNVGKINKNIIMNGKFIISLDFELMWGVRDEKDKPTYGNNITGVHKIFSKSNNTTIL